MKNRQKSHKEERTCTMRGLSAGRPLEVKIFPIASHEYASAVGTERGEKGS
jgi:hypothetical protein